MPVAAVSGLILTGCSGAPAIEPTAAPFELVSTPTLATATSTTVISRSPLVFQTNEARARSIVWATTIDPATGAPIDRVEVFPATAPHLYGAVPFEYIADGVSIRGEWSYNNTAMPTLTSSSAIEQPQTDVWIVFELGRNGDTDWPDGEYRLTVLVDEQPALSSTIRVESPAIAD